MTDECRKTDERFLIINLWTIGKRIESLDKNVSVLKRNKNDIAMTPLVNKDIETVIDFIRTCIVSIQGDLDALYKDTCDLECNLAPLKKGGDKDERV